MSNESENKKIDLDQFYGITGLLFNKNSAPELLQALKEAYKEIDALQGKINNARDAMNAYANDEIDNVCEAYEEVCLTLG